MQVFILFFSENNDFISYFDNYNRVMYKFLKVSLFIQYKILILVIFFYLNFNIYADGLTETQIDRFSIKESQTSKLLLASKELLKNQQYEEVIPFLEEIIYRLEDDKDKSVVRTLSFTKFQLAECFMRINNFSDAAKLFENFSLKFPDHELYDNALILSAQNYSFLNSWTNSSRLAHLALENLLLEDELKQKALKSASEADYRLMNWDKCIQSLEKLFRLSDNENDRSNCSVLLVNCFSKKNNFYDIIKFLPFCSIESRNTLSLNTALLEAGDYFYNNSEFIKAQLLYNEVMPVNEILSFHNNQLNQIKDEIVPYRPGSRITLSEHQEQRELLEDEKKKLDDKILLIKSFNSYDAELLFRLAQCAYESGRYWLASTRFDKLSKTYPTNSLYDQSVYSSLISMLEEEEWEKVKKIGYDYINENTNGIFSSEITVNLMKLHMQLNEFDLAKNIGFLSINEITDHKFKDQILFMLGYLFFSEMEYEKSLNFYEKIIADFPSSSLIDEVSYWRSMCYLYLSKFDLAINSLTECLQKDSYKESVFYEDSIFRLGVSYYGLEEFELSKKTFHNFTEQCNSNNLVSEAYSFLGDLYASDGDLNEGLNYYNYAIKLAQNIEQINYPLFQKVDILKIQKDYEKIIFILRDYINQWKEKCSYANAIISIGDAYKKLDEYPQSLQIYLDSIENYYYFNKDEIDKILKIIIDDFRNEELSPYFDVMNNWIYERLEFSEKGSIPYIAYLTILSYENDNNFNDNEFLLSENSIKKSSPMTLNLISQKLSKTERLDLIILIQKQITSNFPESDYVIDISEILINSYLLNEKFKEAELLAKNIVNNDSVNYSRMGSIHKLHADSLRLQNQFICAIEEYENILKEREWKGELTPEVLYWIGHVYFEMGKYDLAYQYFQRVYILYGNYEKWVRESYIMSIYCLDKSDSSNAIIMTYNEMKNLNLIDDSEEIKNLILFLKKKKIIDE